MQVLSGFRQWSLLSAILSVIGVLDSLYLWWTKMTLTSLVCGIGDCDAVNASPYSSLFGIPVAAIGAAGYGVLLVLALWTWRAPASVPYWLIDLRLLLAGLALLFAVYLTLLELFVIHAV